MRIDFRLPPGALTDEERAFLSTQIRFATRFHDVPLAGVRIEFVPENRNRRARLTAIERDGGTVVCEREGATAREAIREGIWVLDRALHTASMSRMSRRSPPHEVWAA